ncbi:hypothetical protein FDENT_13822, partial [Fusarium denticulatum]
VDGATHILPGRIARLVPRLVGVPVAFFACQITKFALCYPNVGRGLSQRGEGVDAASRAIPYQEQLQLHCTDERLIVVIAIVNYLPSPDTDTAILNPTARLSHPDISN